MNSTAFHIVRRLLKSDLKIATVESMTGGGIIEKLTSVPGASQVVVGSLVVYTNDIKRRLLQIADQEFPSQGAVSHEMAHMLAERGLRVMKSDIVIAVTGNAGPSAQDDQPVGKVFIGLAKRLPTLKVLTFEFDFKGTREEIREATFKAAMNLLNEHILSIWN